MKPELLPLSTAYRKCRPSRDWIANPIFGNPIKSVNGATFSSTANRLPIPFIAHTYRQSQPAAIRIVVTYDSISQIARRAQPSECEATGRRNWFVGQQTSSASVLLPLNRRRRTRFLKAGCHSFCRQLRLEFHQLRIRTKGSLGFFDCRLLLWT